MTLDRVQLVTATPTGPLFRRRQMVPKVWSHCSGASKSPMALAMNSRQMAGLNLGPRPHAHSYKTGGWAIAYHQWLSDTATTRQRSGLRLSKAWLLITMGPKEFEILTPFSRQSSSTAILRIVTPSYHLLNVSSVAPSDILFPSYLVATIHIIHGGKPCRHERRPYAIATWRQRNAGLSKPNVCPHSL